MSNSAIVVSQREDFHCARALCSILLDHLDILGQAIQDTLGTKGSDVSNGIATPS